MSDRRVIEATVADPEFAVAEALAAGTPVLLEAPGRLSVEALERLAEQSERTGVRAWAALSLRFEPTAVAAGTSLATGAIGLPVAANAQALWVDAPDPATLALDVLDMLLHVCALAVEDAIVVSMTAQQVIASLRMSHGVVGMVTAIPRPDGMDGHPSTSLRVIGSHGMIIANLDAPSLVIEGRNPIRRRMDADGPVRLREAFAASGGGPTLRRAAQLSATLRRGQR
jgi:predicted dehydrogenase